MKQIIWFLCFALVFSMVIAEPVAATEIELCANKYISLTSVTLTKTSDTSFNTWFTLTGAGSMTEIGISMLRVQQSPDGHTWPVYETYYPADFPQMMGYDTVQHSATIPYYGAETGFYYRVFVMFHAKNSSGTGTAMEYSNIIYLPNP